MRNLFVLLLTLLSFSANGQVVPADLYAWLNFDAADTFYHNVFSVDTVNYHHNLWQIGRPQKTIFDSAHSLPNAILTDTLLPYPANDTSVFTLVLPTQLPAPYLFAPGGALGEFSFFYKLDIDSTTLARIEISLDHGISWIDLKDSLPLQPYPLSSHDTLYRTKEWKLFYLDFGYLLADAVDTVMFRFTLASDSSSTIMDGWMMDDFSTRYISESVPQILNPNFISLYPNPSSGNMYLHANKPLNGNASVAVYNMQGLQVYASSTAPANGYINLQLPPGLYTLKYYTADEYCVKRIEIVK
jgi:hypothetical protein